MGRRNGRKISLSNLQHWILNVLCAQQHTSRKGRRKSSENGIFNLLYFFFFAFCVCNLGAEFNGRGKWRLRSSMRCRNNSSRVIFQWRWYTCSIQWHFFLAKNRPQRATFNNSKAQKAPSGKKKSMNWEQQHSWSMIQLSWRILSRLWNLCQRISVEVPLLKMAFLFDIVLQKRSSKLQR